MGTTKKTGGTGAMSPLRRPAILLATAIAALFVFSSVSGSTAVAESPPAAPSDLVWEGGLPGQPLQFYWQDNSDNETGFKLLARVGGGPMEVRSVLPANSTSAPTPSFTFQDFCDSIVARVVAFNDAGDSEPSNEAHLPPPPSGCHGTFQMLFANGQGGPAVEADFPEWHGVEAARLVANAPGCSEPQWLGNDLRWPTPCVDPGESITIEFDVVSPAFVGEPIWLVPTFGDAQCDGDTDAVDALFILRDVAGIEPLSACGLMMGETDFSGTVDAIDAWRVLAIIAGLAITT
jgi:hypothetical protein